MRITSCFLVLAHVMLGLVASSAFALPGRGELDAWTPLAGAWEGSGTDAAGSTAVKASLESLFGGRFLLLHTSEQRADQSVREELEVWSGGETPGAFVYHAKDPFQRLPGAVDADGAALSAGDAKTRITWHRTADGLTGTREEADATGALVATGSWTLKRGARDVDGPEVELIGKFKGEGETCATIGSAVGVHFNAVEEGSLALSSGILITRQTYTYADRVEQALFIHGVEHDKPFRHEFHSKGAVLALTGAFVDVGQMAFTTDTPAGKLKVSTVEVCHGYKLETEILRPGTTAAVWVGSADMYIQHGKRWQPRR